MAITGTKDIKKLSSNAVDELNCLQINSPHSKNLNTYSLDINSQISIITESISKLSEFISSLEGKREEFMASLSNHKDTLNRLLHPNDFRLSLIYKLQNNIPYIKGRCYWDNKQREVQIGSIDSAISQLSDLITSNLYPPVKGLDRANIDWDYIKSKPDIEDGIKYVGKVRFKQYILKRLYNDGIKLDAEPMTDIDAIEKSVNPPISIQSDDWYSNWRKDNL